VAAILALLVRMNYFSLTRPPLSPLQGQGTEQDITSKANSYFKN